MKKLLLILTITAAVFTILLAVRTKTFAYCCGGWYWCCGDDQDKNECSKGCYNCPYCQGPPEPVCNPGGCGGCTPSCPAGQSTTVTGDLCRQGISSCTGSDGCNACTLTGGYCYSLETNVAPAIPTSISMIVEGVTYQLSTDPNNPTHIKLPAVGTSDVKLTEPTFTAPATSRGGGYYFIANNYGVDNEWSTWVSCSGTAGEDFCTTVPSTNNTQNFVPTSKTINQVLKEGARGKISGMYTTLDKCANTYKYSLPREGYYVVDIVPDLPNIVNPQDIFPDITSDITAKGCTSLTYTGLDINNPLHVNVAVTDSNSVDEIQAFTLWFSKDTSIPQTTNISSTCSTGYFSVGTGICCPNNTTYTGGKCVAAGLQSTSDTFSATGGTITTSGSYTLHTFTSSGTFTANASRAIDALIVGGGGAGHDADCGGGGGGGKVVSQSTTISSGSFPVVVGSGGASNSSGSSSSFNSITATGGTAGTSAGVTGTGGASGNGYAGGNGGSYSGGGGGGAGAIGGTGASFQGGTGGIGVASSITGTNTYYGGGGGGGAQVVGLGGSGGGGKGGFDTPGTAGTANTGGGGGGGDGTGIPGGSGGKGVVIVRYLTPTNICTTGYFLASSTVCCPNNTTYSGSQCTADTTMASGSPSSGSSTSDLGIMIKKDGSVLVTNSAFEWVSLSNGYIVANNTNIIRVYDVSITKTENVTFDFKLEFLEDSNNLSGMYNIYGGGLDSYMINGSTVDQSYFTKLFDWGVDLVNPSVETLSQQVQDPINTKITWGVSDPTSGIKRAVMNGYRVGGTQFDIAKLYLPSAYTTNKGDLSLNSVPLESQIGLYNETNAWAFDNNTGEADLLNIGANESGKIDIYVTAYDNACNTTGDSEEVDLDPWFATRGGSLYSNGSILSTPKDVSSSTALQGGILKNFTDSQLSLLDTGTETLSSLDSSIINIIHPTLGATEALGVYDSTDVKNIWFDSLKTSFKEMQDNLQRIYDITDICDEACYMLSEDANVDITIPKDYVCTRPTLFISERDINISPDITNDDTHLSGCIFLAKRNINVSGGDYVSDSKIQYDYLEGFFIAENQIVFELSDVSKSLRDGIEIKGSMIALGSEISTGTEAIDIQRNLRLFNQTNPAVVMTYDNRYSSISQLFFGIAVPTYRQDIGFKAF